MQIHSMQNVNFCVPGEQLVRVDWTLGVQEDDWSYNILVWGTKTVQTPKKSLRPGLRYEKFYKIVAGVGVLEQEKYQPDIICDAMTWEYTRLPREAFDVITMIPSCIVFGQAKNCWDSRQGGCECSGRMCYGNHSVNSLINVVARKSSFCFIPPPRFHASV